MKNKYNWDNVFQPLSKAIIVLPLVIIVIALLLRVSDRLTLSSKQLSIPITPITTPGPTASPTHQAKLNIDLQGPYICKKNSTSLSTSLYIKNQRVYSEIEQGGEQDRFLLSGDCAYKWEKNGRKGEKTCGLSGLLTIYEAMSSVGVVDPADMIDKIVASNQMSASNEAFVRSVIQSCKKEDVADGIFTVPSGVAFTESDFLPDLSSLLK